MNLYARINKILKTIAIEEKLNILSIIGMLIENKYVYINMAQAKSKFGLVPTSQQMQDPHFK